MMCLLLLITAITFPLKDFSKNGLFFIFDLIDFLVNSNSWFVSYKVASTVSPSSIVAKGIPAIFLN